ncbi:MAG: 50S ribosome-binding GTPase [Candidatus Shikimatogenerans bostrichidophilus]|nr:MAG: 50S ribosome-binding GTPase [Candidatus Shikimatogenerans bostrichidophilus]
MIFKNFIDKIKIYCIGGNGGNGIIHFKKKNKKIGKPDGGNGGKGGNIIFIGNKNIYNFYNIKNKKFYKSYNGLQGMKNCKNGKNGKDYIINVPLGTKIIYNKKKIKIKKNKKKIKIILGGKGGKGNNFYKSSINPKSIKFSKGKKGKKILVKLILKINNDISILGLPNTGKSTILSLITNSKPKIDNYFFTTLKPNIGIYNNTNDSIYKKNYIIMDMPAIIKNCYKGKGLGNKYLKYIKNNKILLLVINCNNIKNFYKQYFILKNELLKSKIKINNKKIILIFSKYDKIKKKDIIKIKEKINKKFNFCFFSSKDNKKKNIYILKKKINKLL